MEKFLHARFDKARLEKVAQIQAQTGMNVSQIFRQMVDAVEVLPAQFTVKLSTNSNDGATREGSNAVIAK